MKASPLVSIIIPVYNVKRYLDICVASTLKQSYQNIEVILVDDGSTDDSGKKCDEWGVKDSRIKVIHQKNDGLNSARRSGWKVCSGEYVTFLDSDDFIHEDNIKQSLEVSMEHDADIVVYAYREFKDGEEKQAVDLSEVRQEIRELADKNEIARYCLLAELNLPNIHAMTVWGKLYRRAVVEKIDWDISNYRAFEDNFWTPQAFLAAKKAILISDVLIFYRRNVPYGAYGSEVLSSRLTGNSWNGQPIGYLELPNRMGKFYSELVKDRNIQVTDTEIQNIVYVNQIGRLDGLIHTNLLGEENNLDYIQEVWNQHKVRDMALQSEVDRLRFEYNQLYGIKASARRLAGNMKRRIKKGLENGK